MLSLYWKIFLSFWVTLLIIGFAIAWTTFSMSQTTDGARYSKRFPDREAFHKEFDSVADMLNSKGVDSYKQWLTKHDHSKSTYFIINEKGQEIQGKRLPPPIRDLLEYTKLGVFNTDDLPKDFFRSKHFRFLNVSLPSGEIVGLAAGLKRQHGFKRLFTPSRIFMALLISALVCILWARYLTRPIRELRLATHKLSAGDLDVRVSHNIGRRGDEITALANDFDNMAEQLQKVMNAQHQLLRDISHELRSPLARMQIALELLRKKVGDETEPEIIRIEKEAILLSELVAQLLTLSRLETDNAHLEKSSFNLSELLHVIVEDAEFEAHAYNCHVALSNGQPLNIEANPTMLSSAIENVIRNAIRYTKKDTTVKVELRSQEDGWISIKITDKGDGVPDEFLNSIFKPFTRADDARSRNNGGYGIGLSITERVILAHQGKVFARNISGAGLQIELLMPSQ